MDRRSFLTATGAGLAASTLAAPAIAQSMPELKWRCTSSFPKSLDTLYGGAVRLAENVAALTDNKFQIQVFAPGELVPALQALDAAQNNTVEIAHSSSYYYTGKDLTFAFGTTVPFGLNTRQMMAWMYNAGGLEVLQEFYDNYNLIHFPAGNTGAQMGGWFRKEIKSLQDLQGIKMRIPGFQGQVMARLGVIPQQIAGGDIYPALEKGTIDAAEWVGPYDDEKLGFYKVAPYYYYPGWWEGSAQVSFFINKQQWESLPKVYQAAFRIAATDAHNWMLAKYDAQNPAALKRLIAQGAQLKAFSQDLMKAAYKAARELMSEEAAKNPRFKKVHDAYWSFRNDEISWFQVAEFNFDYFVIANAGS